MQSYWLTAGEKPNATKHDIEHSTWYKKVAKIVLSRTMNGTGIQNATIISDQLTDRINKLKQQEGKNILIFGSPGASQSLLNQGLIDEFWLLVNPIILGQGIPLFKDIIRTTKLKIIETKLFDCGVIALHYEKI
jgi:dihydrofolate reductase